MLYIGIDTGVHTGVAVWDTTHRRFLSVVTLSIHRAMEMVLSLQAEHPSAIRVVFEDARLRKWFGDAGREQLQGAGAVKRDAKIWEDFLKDYGIPFQAVAPAKGATKWDAKRFATMTGWTGRTSNHARDACLLVFGR